MPLTPGDDFGPYHILGRLGEGGMATVFRARQDSPRREVALKVIGAHLASSESFQSRFRFEADVLASLEHPNILPVFATGTAEGVAYIAYRYVSGGTLKQRLGRPMQVEHVVTLLRPVAAALDFAHAHGVIHRDIKPANILFTAEETPIVADFGLAKLLEAGLEKEEALTQTGVSMGTPAYMAPEQVEGLVLDGQVDEYALAIVAFEMLSGTVPYIADTPLAVALKQVREPLPPASSRNAEIAPAVDAVLTRGAAKDPFDRYPSCTELVNALAATAHPSSAETAFYPVLAAGTAGRVQNATGPLPAPTGGDGASRTDAGAMPGEASAPRSGRRTLLVGACAALVLVIIAGVAVALRGGGKKSGAAAGNQANAVAAVGAASPEVVSSTPDQGAIGVAGTPGTLPGAAAAAAGQTTATPRPVIPLPATVSVAGADPGSGLRLAEARADLGSIFNTLVQGYGPMPAQRLSVTLAATEQAARTQLTTAGFTTTFISSFFSDGDRLAARSQPDGSVFALVYLPAAGDLRAALAEEAATFYINGVGHPGQADTYAYWFDRGFPLYWQTRFSSKEPPYHANAVADAKAKTAPPLETLLTPATASAWEKTQTSGLARVDARAEAAVAFLEQRYGEPVVAQLLRSGANGTPAGFDALLQQATGQTPATLDALLDTSLVQ